MGTACSTSGSPRSDADRSEGQTRYRISGPWARTQDAKDVFIEIAAMRAPARDDVWSGSGSVDVDARQRDRSHSGTSTCPRRRSCRCWAKPSRPRASACISMSGTLRPITRLVRRPTAPGDPYPYNSAVADDYIIGAGGLSGSDPARREAAKSCEETACDAAPVRRRSIVSSPSIRERWAGRPASSCTRNSCSMPTGRTRSGSRFTPTRRRHRNH